MFNKKVLCIGNNSEDTDRLVSNLATAQGTNNYGIVCDAAFIPNNPGYYHTTLTDIPSGGIVKLSDRFDVVELLDQPSEEWSHWKLLLSSYRLMSTIAVTGKETNYLSNNNIKPYLEFDNFLKTNKSFCIYPWIEKIEFNGNLSPCARSFYPITPVNKLTDWAADPEYTKIREKMLKGERLPEMCKTCYDIEDRGIESYREFETKEWLGKLNIHSLEDLNDITHPYYYEVRLSNACNIACRGCVPEHSSRIETEYKKYNIIVPKQPQQDQSSINIIDTSTLSPKVRVYLTGGEPTIIPDVYSFMDKCINENKTDFDLTISTNAEHLSKRFLSLAEKFSSMHFSISIDGYKQINDYWRWGSHWDNIIANVHTLQQQGHTISVNCVPGIYNVTNLHLLLEFLDREFPFANLYLQLNYHSSSSAFNHPLHNLVIDSMSRCRNTRIYHTDGKSVKSTIDQLYNHYLSKPKCNLDHLSEFFKFNDRLDEIRHVRLKDYIPELEACRQFIQKG